MLDLEEVKFLVFKGLKDLNPDNSNNNKLEMMSVIEGQLEVKKANNLNKDLREEMMNTLKHLLELLNLYTM